jgi:hypothetical protein
VAKLIFEMKNLYFLHSTGFKLLCKIEGNSINDGNFCKVHDLSGAAIVIIGQGHQKPKYATACTMLYSHRRYPEVHISNSQPKSCYTATQSACKCNIFISWISYFTQFYTQLEMVPKQVQNRVYTVISTYP